MLGVVVVCGWQCSLESQERNGVVYFYREGKQEVLKSQKHKVLMFQKLEVCFGFGVAKS